MKSTNRKKSIQQGVATATERTKVPAETVGAVTAGGVAADLGVQLDGGCVGGTVARKSIYKNTDGERPPELFLPKLLLKNMDRKKTSYMES